MDDVPLIGVGDEEPQTTSPQHAETPATAQPPPPQAPQPPATATQPIPQQPPVAMAGSYPTVVYPNIAYAWQPGTVQIIQAPQPALQPQAQAVLHEKLLPSDYLVVTVVFFILCTIFNPTSLMIGIPALLLSFKAYNNKCAGKYRQAKIFGNVAIYLTLVNIIYTLMADILIISLTLGLYCPSTYYYRYGSRC